MRNLPKKDTKIFDQELIDKLFSEERDQLIVGRNPRYSLYKFTRGSRYEFRIEKNLNTIFRFYFVKDKNSKAKLIEFLTNLEMFEGTGNNIAKKDQKQ